MLIFVPHTGNVHSREINDNFRYMMILLLIDILRFIYVKVIN
jgi:hypothetical protein